MEQMFFICQERMTLRERMETGKRAVHSPPLFAPEP